MADQGDRTNRRRRAWDTAAVLLSVLLVTTGAAYVEANDAGPVPPIVLGLLLGGQPILARYRPLTAWVTLVAGMTLFAYTAQAISANTAWPPTVMFCAVVVLFGVAVVHRRSVAIGAWAAPLLIAGVAWSGSAAGQTNFPLLAALSGLALVAGDNVRGRREARARLREEERRSSELQRRRSLLEERARIARELHDIVAHHMSVIAVQASTAAYRSPGLPAEAIAEFDSIAAAARSSLAELRRLLTVLRGEGEPAEHSPQPGLADLDSLVRTTEQAGTVVTLNRGQLPEPVSPGAGLTAYRIVQEALSNVVRHAPGAWAAVELRGEPDHLVVEVVNPVAAVGSAAVPAGNGYGLRGMRERAELLGGRLDVTTEDGRFRVRAVLPVGLPEDIS